MRCALYCKIEEFTTLLCFFIFLESKKNGTSDFNDEEIEEELDDETFDENELAEDEGYGEWS